jgi:opacity protein-like surface antigen
MKRLIIVVFMLFGFTAVIVAQTKGDVEFGFNVGYNNSTVSSTYDSAEAGSGFNVGFAADYYFSDRWSIRGKLIYDQKGWDNGFITDLDSGNTFFTDYNLNYLTVPVMANWHFGKKRNWYLDFGPYVGFLMSAKDTEFELDLKDGFNSTDFGLALGIGVKIPVSDKMKLTFEYEGQSGLSNIFKESNTNVSNSRSSLNVGINFMMK